MTYTKCSGSGDCNGFFLPLNDLMGVLNGKWKMRLILCLSSEPKRFNEMKKCHGISPRILSKELKDLEINGVVLRTELNDNLKSVEYSLTDAGKELVSIILQLQKWGTTHRQNVLEENDRLK
ncbi:winged helix-turn-helix transcriptional regulator [Carboxylicivirga linearis]|uniref:Helix-turn-helix transcriptional regulator n=1 Tax=Carboxylicivirga linearis TaxID=1628157 RepID=A0ABS5K0P1_9BACT|nr:helix-turn-helix domain-containing protein [Carboxylicivirga linearis]MBS2100752.1 helix-turn-helix transcriptional regulator [Carboxylicivirga linearis]